MTSRHVVSTADGLTHASSVMPVERCKDGSSGIVTLAPPPSNWSAPPLTPLGVQVALAMVPSFPRPDQSMTCVPAPSSNEYAATRPVPPPLASVQLSTVAAVRPVYGRLTMRAIGVAMADRMVAV